MAKIKNFVLFLIMSFIILFVGCCALNYRFDISLKLFYSDVLNLFVDNEYAHIYMYWLCFLMACVACIGYVLFSPCLLRWKIVFRGHTFIYTAGTLLRKITVYSDCAGLILMCLLLFSEVTSNVYMKVDSKTIGHSFGLVDGLSYTGSYEAFKENYEAGQRVFEVDLLPTADQKLVLRHKWNDNIQSGFSNDNIPTEQEFKQVKIYDYLTPLSFEDLCQILQEHPDMYIVTDTKYVDVERMVPEFQIMSQTLHNGYQNILNQIIVQVYSKEMYEVVKKEGYQQIIFTLYNIWEGDIDELIDLCRFCVNHGINTVTIPEKYYTSDVQEVVSRYGLLLYLHTVNDIDTARTYLKQGVKGVYTDTIMPNDLEDY